MEAAVGQSDGRSQLDARNRAMATPNTPVTPKLRPWVRVRKDADGAVSLLYPEGVMELNETGAHIVELCDGTRTATEIAQRLAAMFDAPDEMLMADVTEFLQRLRDRGLNGSSAAVTIVSKRSARTLCPAALKWQQRSSRSTAGSSPFSFSASEITSSERSSASSAGTLA